MQIVKCIILKSIILKSIILERKNTHPPQTGGCSTTLSKDLDGVLLSYSSRYLPEFSHRLSALFYIELG